MKLSRAVERKVGSLQKVTVSDFVKVTWMSPVVTIAP